MTVIRKVALAGATGALGQAILKALLDAGFTVTILTRTESTKDSPADVALAKVDYASTASIAAAIAGHDALVSALGRAGLEDAEARLVDAALQAGVPRFVPSAFGGDIRGAYIQATPFFADKIKPLLYLEKKAHESAGALTHTSFTTGPLFDFVLAMKLLINLPERKIVLYDGGEKSLSVTTRNTVGRAVAEALKRPNETANRMLYVHDAVVSQQELLAIGKSLTPGDEWTIAEADTTMLSEKAAEAWDRGLRAPQVGPGFLLRGLFQDRYGGPFEKPDNELLGLGVMDKDELRAFMKRFL